MSEGGAARGPSRSPSAGPRSTAAADPPSGSWPAEPSSHPGAELDRTPAEAPRALDDGTDPLLVRAGIAEVPGAGARATDRAGTPPVVVLLALYQGAAHLDAQLASIAAQGGGAPPVIVSDDGSTDGGPAILRRHAEAGMRIRAIVGPRGGAAANFLHLLRAAGPDVPHAALSDQDDVWLPNKTARALRALAEVPPGVPAIHCGRTMICDAEGAVLRPSILHARPPSFRNALVQSLAGGNTMTLNRAALDLAQAAAEEAGEIVVHDWWLYQIVSGAGGRMIYDPEPLLLYRQHGSNAIGENTTTRALARRAAMVVGGRFRAWSEVNLRALSASRHRLTEDSCAVLDGFASMRRQGPTGRLAALRRLGLYRQTRVGDAALRAAALMGRI